MIFEKKHLQELHQLKDKEKYTIRFLSRQAWKNKTIGDVISYADKSDLCILDDTINDFIKVINIYIAVYLK